ncbi:MAG: SGNH/GDSL hydrolase family protein [Fibrobacteria bacterium]
MSNPKFKLSVVTVACVSVFTGCFVDSSDDDSDNGIKAQYYVAVGNSLTAGYQSGGLREDWQKSSYPALIAEKMGVADFQLPLIATPGIGRTKIGGKNTVPYYLDATGSITTRILDASVTSLLVNSRLDRPYNNLGIPGMTTKDFIYAYDSATSQSGNNGFFNIVMRGGLLNNTSPMRQAIRLKPTVLTMWVGNNDILGGITEGTIREVPDASPTVTPTALYASLMDKALDTLLNETTARIFLANLPAITTIPFVTTVPTYVFLPETFQPAVSADVKFQTVEANVEYILVTALPLILGKHGVPAALGGLGDSLPANVTLTKTEADAAARLTNEYNAYLKSKADASPRIDLVDVNALLGKLQKGELAPLTGAYPLLDPTNSAYSLDGIHPNSKGYKHITNLFIDAINSGMGKSYSRVD